MKRTKAHHPTQIVSVKFRMTEAVRQRLAASAKERGGSLNAEINHRVQQSFLLDDLLEARLIAKREWEDA